MNRKNISRALTSVRFSAIAALAVLALLFSASGAKAGGCAANYPAGYKASTAPPIPFVSPSADAHPTGEEYGGPASIVGMWHLIYTATYSTSGPLPVPAIPRDHQVPSSSSKPLSIRWHAGRTEFENAFLPPTGGNVCFGVWKEIGENSIKLHHIGLMFDSEGKVSFIFTVNEKKIRSPRTVKPTRATSLSSSGQVSTIKSASAPRYRLDQRNHRRYPYQRRLSKTQPEKMHAARLGEGDCTSIPSAIAALFSQAAIR